MIELEIAGIFSVSCRNIKKRLLLPETLPLQAQNVIMKKDKYTMKAFIYEQQLFLKKSIFFLFN